MIREVSQKSFVVARRTGSRFARARARERSLRVGEVSLCFELESTVLSFRSRFHPSFLPHASAHSLLARSLARTPRRSGTICALTLLVRRVLLACHPADTSPLQIMGRTQQPSSPVLRLVRGWPDKLRELLQKDPSVMTTPQKSYYKSMEYPLEFAVRYGLVTAVEILLEHGAPVSYTQHKLLLCDAVVRVPL